MDWHGLAEKKHSRQVAICKENSPGACAVDGRLIQIVGTCEMDVEPSGYQSWPLSGSCSVYRPVCFLGADGCPRMWDWFWI
jgi:hypothetical protein